jgi:hypothetical protein
MVIVREVVRDSGKQESAASDLGISPELLSQALRSQRTFHAAWLPAILRYDHGHKILGYLAWESHCRVSVIEPLTKGEKYDLLIAELKRGAADVEGIERRAYAEPEEEREQ